MEGIDNSTSLIGYSNFTLKGFILTRTVFTHVDPFLFRARVAVTRATSAPQQRSLCPSTFGRGRFGTGLHFS